MSILIIAPWIVLGLITVALVSLAAHLLEKRHLQISEIILTFIFWPYFLVAFVGRLNTDF